MRRLVLLFPVVLGCFGCSADRALRPTLPAYHVASVETGNVPWHLDRIDQAWLPFDQTYDTGTSGAGVDLYFIDTGIEADHQEFGGRASMDVDYVNDGRVDCTGHGTATASIAAGITTGVAPLARVHAIRIYGCSGDGPDSLIIAALNWVIANGSHPGVINLSLVADSDLAGVDSAVQHAIDAGFTVVTAAGNAAIDACFEAPAQVSAAITVGAIQANDAIASYSNQGPCVDVFAPAHNLYSAFSSGPTAYTFLTGTSAATPVVTGIAARYLSGHPTALPAEVSSWVVSQATPNALEGAWANSPNLVARADRMGQPLPSMPSWYTTTPHGPVAVLTVMGCSGLTCTFSVLGSATSPSNTMRCDVDFGDHKKQSAVAGNVAHTYGRSGTYTVTVTVTDAQSRKASTTRTVVVSGLSVKHG